MPVFAAQNREQLRRMPDDQAYLERARAL